VLVVQLPGDGTGDLREAAKALGTVADAALSGGAPSVDVVGYSAGGITARYWVKELGGAAHARRVVTLGSPHHGTQLAAIGPLLGATCPIGCRQLAPGSELLADLNAGDETPAGPTWLSMWSATDQVVTPPETARLDGATNVVLQGICPGETADHGQLATMPLVAGIVLEALGTSPLDAPRPADCTELQATGRGSA
jgi:triacylglycerol esterase/lipase EstA (alpha/beta hydrolase family)